MTRRAIILIPGFAKRERLDARDRLVDALHHYTDGWLTTTGGAEAAQSPEAVHLRATSRQDSSISTDLDVYEAYWGDLVPDWSQESPWARFKRGWGLICYWMAGGLLRAVWRWEFPPRTMVAMATAGTMLLLWYAVIVAVLLKALAEGNLPLPKFITNIEGAEAWIETWLIPAGEWPITLFLVGLLGLGALEMVANTASFAKAYLRDDTFGGNTVGLRAKSRARVLEVLDTVTGVGEGKAYDEIHVVAHSLGGAIAVDALAEYGRDLSRIRLFTWGSALGALSQQEPLIEAEIRKFHVSETRIANWIDVVFKWDYMGSKVPVPKQADGKGRMARIFPETLEPAVPRRGLARFVWLFGIHEDYYRSEDALLLLVKPVADLPQPMAPAARGKEA